MNPRFFFLFELFNHSFFFQTTHFSIAIPQNKLATPQILINTNPIITLLKRLFKTFKIFAQWKKGKKITCPLQQYY